MLQEQIWCTEKSRVEECSVERMPFGKNALWKERLVGVEGTEKALIFSVTLLHTIIQIDYFICNFDKHQYTVR